MKSRTILFCAVALCFEFVVSIPFSVDSQRYSGYYTRPDGESYYQGNAQRPWNQQYDLGEYKVPGLQQYQGRQYPNINRDNYYSQNQRRYLPKTPPQQPEIINVKYVNQQTTPTENVQNRQIYESRPVQDPENILQAPPQSINSEPIVSAIPAIPAFPLRNQPQMLQAKEREIPVIQPSPPRMERENVPAVDNLDRYLAKAANPVEQISEPRRPARPDIELYLSNPNIRKVLSTTKQKRRFLVIHPDGTVEHIDRLEKIAEKHPHYFLVKAGDVVANWNNDKSTTTVPLTQLPLPPAKPLEILSEKMATPVNAVLEAPFGQPTVANGVSSPIEPKPAIEISMEEPKPVPIEEIPSAINVDAVVQDPATTSDITDNPQIQPSVINIEIESVAKSDPVVAIAVAEAAPVNNETTMIVPPSEPVIETIALAPEPVLENIAPVPESVIVNDAPVPDPAAATIAPVSEPAVVAAAPASEPIISAVAPLSGPVVANIEQAPGPVVAAIALAPGPVIANSTPELEPKTQEANPSASVVSDINENSASGSSNIVVPVVTDEDIFDQASRFIASPDADIPNFGDLDISKVPAKPALWFRTTDPNIWEKLSNPETGMDVVYFFQIYNQPKIGRDIIKTIHPNGTIVEDIVERVWDFEGDTPRITQTSTVIIPGDL